MKFSTAFFLTGNILLMTGTTQNIIKKIFQSDSLENISVQQLQELVAQHPSFGAAHYLLSKKLKLDNNASLGEQVQKTALYFTNPNWLQWLLKNIEEKKSLIKIDEPIIINENKTQPIINDEKKEEIIVEKKESNENEIVDSISKSVLQQTVNASTEIKEEAIAFEPYHTIDYFASQGIKFVQEVNPNDKLGRQLKSFTEWLKVMKKLPQKTIEQSIDEPTRENIETEAEQSVTGKEIVTEAMAEVLIKQGKTNEAAEIYRKLSLHNHDKSAYFAAKIEQLKV
jgi:hypothetical protein